MTSHYDDRPLRYDDTYTGPRQLTSGEITAFQLTPLVVDEAPCAWCSEVAPLREWTHESGEVEDLCPRCYRAAEEQRARERGV